jgi:hypothetical protein
MKWRERSNRSSSRRRVRMRSLSGYSYVITAQKLARF